MANDFMSGCWRIWIFKPEMSHPFQHMKILAASYLALSENAYLIDIFIVYLSNCPIFRSLCFYICQMLGWIRYIHWWKISLLPIHLPSDFTDITQYLPLSCLCLPKSFQPCIVTRYHTFRDDVKQISTCTYIIFTFQFQSCWQLFFISLNLVFILIMLLCLLFPYTWRELSQLRPNPQLLLLQ